MILYVRKSLKTKEFVTVLSHLNISQRTNLPAKETTSTSSREDKGDELVVADNTENESRIVTSREVVFRENKNSVAHLLHVCFSSCIRC